VIVEGEANRSCITPVSAVEGLEILTLEGLGTTENPHPIQRAFIAEQAVQCGYCINGMILTAKVLVDQNPNPTDGEIREALAENLCRCAMHLRVIRAVKRYAEETRG
jgi:nicotinate dehydrogenase subunit A